MDRIEPVEPDPPTHLAAHPEFELEYYLDHDEDPTTVTICSTESSGKIATEWITVDVSHAVAIEHVR